MAAAALAQERPPGVRRPRPRMRTESEPRGGPAGSGFGPEADIAFLKQPWRGAAAARRRPGAPPEAMGAKPSSGDIKLCQATAVQSLACGPTRPGTESGRRPDSLDCGGRRP